MVALGTIVIWIGPCLLDLASSYLVFGGTWVKDIVVQRSGDLSDDYYYPKLRFLLDCYQNWSAFETLFGGDVEVHSYYRPFLYKRL